MIDAKRGLGSGRVIAGTGMLAAVLLGAGLIALPGVAPRLIAADAPPVDVPAGPVHPPVAAESSLVQEDPLDAPTEYERRLLQLPAAARGAGAQPAALLHFNAALAWRADGQPRRVLTHLQWLVQFNANDFNVQCLLLETLGQLNASPAELAPTLATVQLQAGDQLARQVRVVKLIEAMPAETRPLKIAGDVIERGLAAAEAAHNWDAFWGWTRLEDERLTLLNDTASRLKLWEYPLRRKMPLDHLRLREAQAQIFDLEDADVVRPEASRFWANEFTDARADWPADAPVSAQLDRVNCLRQLLKWEAPSAGGAQSPADISKSAGLYSQYALACGGADRLAACSQFIEWLEATAKAAPESRTALNRFRGQVSTTLIADPQATGPELIFAGEGLITALKTDLELDSLPMTVKTKADPNSAIAEPIFAAVIAFDRADKAGTPSGTRGLQAVLYAIQVTGEDPDFKVDRAPRYQILHDYERLLADKAVAFEAAKLFVEFKAGKVPHWQATQEVLTLAAAQHAPAATVAALIRGETWPTIATGEAETVFGALMTAYKQDPQVNVAVAEQCLKLDRWNAASAALQPLATLQPSGSFQEDVATAQSLLVAQPLSAQLPSEVQAVLAAAFNLAPVDSFIRNKAAQALSDLQYAQGDVAAAEKTLQSWWDSSSTARALSAAMQARVALTLVREQDLAQAEQLYTAVQSRLPGDPVSRLAVLKAMLSALADGGAIKDYAALADRELKNDAIPAQVRVDLLNICADEWIVQGNVERALQFRADAFSTARTARLAMQGAANPTAGCTAILRDMLLRMRQDVSRFPTAAAALEQTLVTLGDPADAEPVVSQALAEVYAGSNRAKEAAALTERIATERPWNGQLLANAALAATQIGDRAAAIQADRALLALHPDDLNAVIDLCTLGLASGDAAIWREQFDRLKSAPGRFAETDFAARLVAMNRADLALALVAARQKTTGHVDPGEVQFLCGYWVSQGHTDRAVMVLAQFATARAQETAATGVVTKPARVGDLTAMITAWSLSPADQAALPELLQRAELSLSPELQPAAGGVAGLNPAVLMTARELQLCRADLLLRAGKTEDALGLLEVVGEADFDALIRHFGNQSTFRAMLCEKMLKTPPVGDPSFEFKLHVQLAVAEEQSGKRDQVLSTYAWLAEHCKPAQKIEWQEGYARLLLTQNRWQEALALYVPIVRQHHAWNSALAVWRILRDHADAQVTLEGKPQTKEEFILSLVAAGPGRAEIEFHRELTQQIFRQGENALAETLARAVLDEDQVADRSQDRLRLMQVLQAAKNETGEIALLDKEAVVRLHRDGLAAFLPTYIQLLKSTKTYTRDAILNSAYLQNLPAADVWSALVQQADNNDQSWAEFLDLGLDAKTTWDAGYFAALLQYGMVDDALTAMLGSAQVSGLAQQPDWRQQAVVQILGARLPTLGAALELQRAKALKLETLDGTRAALHAAALLTQASSMTEAQAVYASLSLKDPPSAVVAGAKLPAAVVPASLCETVRAAYFEFLLAQRCDIHAVAKLLPTGRRPGSLALRQAVWNQWRAAGLYRTCVKDMDVAMQSEGLHELSDELRRNLIYDLLAAAVETAVLANASVASTGAAGPGAGSAASQARNQAFQLAFEALRRTEFNLRRGSSSADAAAASEESFDQWLYILRNISRYDPAQREELNALLWNLAQSESFGNVRDANAVLATAGDIGGDTARLTAVDKLIGVHASVASLKPVRLELLRRLKRTDEVIAALRENLAASPDDPEALFALARELPRDAAGDLSPEAQALLNSLIQRLNPLDLSLLRNWAQMLRTEGFEEPALRLNRMAWMASPDAAVAAEYARALQQAGQTADAVQVLLQSLFVREWRTREGSAEFRNTLQPLFGVTLTQMLITTEGYAAALHQVDAALVNAVSPRHRAQLLEARYELLAVLDRRADAIDSLTQAVNQNFPQQSQLAEACLNQLNNLGWRREYATLTFALAQTVAGTPVYVNRMDAAAHAFETAGMLAEAVTALRTVIEQSPKDTDLSPLHFRLALLLHQLKSDVPAIVAFKDAMATGTQNERYTAWNAWRGFYRDNAVPADRDATLADFGTYLTQADSVASRVTIRRDYLQWLSTQNQDAEYEKALKLQLAEMEPRQRAEPRQMYIQLLTRLKRFSEAAEQAGLGLQEGSIYYYNLRESFQPVFARMSGSEAAEWIFAKFQNSDLPWNTYNNLLSYWITDYTARQEALTRLAELMGNAHPGDRQILLQAIASLCQVGEYDRAYRLADQALAGLPAPAAGQTGGFRRRLLALWLKDQLNSYACRDKALALLEISAAGDAPHGWNRGSVDLQRGDLAMNGGHADQALALWNGIEKDPASFPEFRAAARQRVFQYNLDWQRDGAASEALYAAALAENPRDPQVMSMLTRLIQFYRNLARHDKCGDLLKARLAAGALTPAETDDLTLLYAQTQWDALMADGSEPSSTMVEPIFQVFARAYVRMCRVPVPEAVDALFNRSRAMLVQIWTRGKTSAPWRLYEPRLQALADQERPNAPRISELQVEVLQSRLELEKAALELARRFAADPSNLALHNELIQAYVEAKQFSAAADLLKADCTARPQDYRPAFALVDLYLAGDMKSAVEAAWATALQLAPEDPAELERLGHHYEDRRRYEWALELYRRAQARAPSIAAADNLARIGERLEQPLEAIKVYLAFYDGLFHNADWVKTPLDFSLAERITPYARNERDFDAAVSLVEGARAKAPQAAERAFLTVALAELQALRRRQSAALDLYQQSLSGEFPRKSDLLLYLLQRLPAQKAADTARALARATVADPAFTTRYDFAEQLALVQAYTAAAADTGAAAADRDAVDAAWRRLIADAPTDRLIELSQTFAERLSDRHESVAACAVLENVIAAEKSVEVRKNILARECDIYEAEKQWREAALVGDRLCQLEAVTNGPNFAQNLAHNVARWLQVPDQIAAAALLTAMAAEPTVSDEMRRACFNALINRLQNWQPKADFTVAIAPMAHYLPADEAWKVTLFQARRLGAANLADAQALIDQLKPSLATDAARLGTLDTEITILTMNQRYGQAANLYRDALKTWGDKLPGGRLKLIDLYFSAGRYDSAMQECTAILGGDDLELIRQSADPIRRIGYNYQSLKDPAKRMAFGPLAEATLATHSPEAMEAAFNIWVEILKDTRHTNELLDFSRRAIAAAPVNSYQRRNMVDQASNQIYQVLYNNDSRQPWPQPAPADVLAYYQLAIASAFDSANYQVSESYTSAILQKMNLEPQMAAQIAASAAANIQKTSRPMVVFKRAGDLINRLTSSQRALAVVQWQAALDAGSPVRSELYRDLRDAALARDDYAAALASQGTLLQLEPWNFEYRTQNAAILTRLNRTVEADAAWQQAAMLAETSEDQLYALAESMRSVNRCEKAVAVYKQAYELAKRRGEVNSNRRATIVIGLTRAEWTLQQHDQAYKFWSDGLARIARSDYNHETLMQALVDLLAAENQLPAIIAAYEKDGRPSGLENANLREAFGRAWQAQSQQQSSEAARRGFEDLALVNLSIAADLLPQEPRVRERMISIYRRRDDRASRLSMVAQYRELSRNDPKNIEYYTNMGYLYRDLGMPDKQEQAWSMILEALPHEGAGHRALAQIYDQEKQYARAISEAQAVIDNRPEDPASYVLHGTMLVHGSRFAEAEPELLKVLARGEEWKAKRYWPNEWQNPTEQALLDLYFMWTRERLQVNDLATAVELRDRAHQQPYVLQQLRNQTQPQRDLNQPVEEWNQRVQAWQFLRDKMPDPAVIQPTDHPSPMPRPRLR